MIKNDCGAIIIGSEEKAADLYKYGCTTTDFRCTSLKVDLEGNLILTLSPDVLLKVNVALSVDLDYLLTQIKTKADKTVLIIALNGLRGGGTLDNDKIYLDLDSFDSAIAYTESGRVYLREIDDQYLDPNGHGTVAKPEKAKANTSYVLSGANTWVSGASIPAMIIKMTVSLNGEDLTFSLDSTNVSSYICAIYGVDSLNHISLNSKPNAALPVYLKGLIPLTIGDLYLYATQNTSDTMKSSLQACLLVLDTTTKQYYLDTYKCIFTVIWGPGTELGGYTHIETECIFKRLTILSELGTPSSTWQINLGTGPKLKNANGVIELRNAADSAYSDLAVNNITINGNVILKGSSFITEAETVLIKDNMLLINDGEPGAGVTLGIAGIEIDRGTAPNFLFVFDETDDRFKAGTLGNLLPIMLRDAEANLVDNNILVWDATNKRAKNGGLIDLSGYLPLAGGFMTGNICLPDGGAICSDMGDNFPVLTSANTIVTVGRPAVDVAITTGDTSVTHKIETPSKTGSYKMWDENNDGTGSGLDADLLDGKHGSDYALAEALNRYALLTDLDKYALVTALDSYALKTDITNVMRSSNIYKVAAYPTDLTSYPEGSIFIKTS